MKTFLVLGSLIVVVSAVSSSASTCYEWGGDVRPPNCGYIAWGEVYTCEGEKKSS